MRLNDPMNNSDDKKCGHFFAQRRWNYGRQIELLRSAPPRLNHVVLSLPVSSSLNVVAVAVVVVVVVVVVVIIGEDERKEVSDPRPQNRCISVWAKGEKNRRR